MHEETFPKLVLPLIHFAPEPFPTVLSHSDPARGVSVETLVLQYSANLLANCIVVHVSMYQDIQTWDV